MRISDWMSDVCSSDLPSTPDPAGDAGRAIGLCLLGVFLFQVLNLLGKHLADSYPIPVLVFFRSFFALLACLVVMAATGGRAHFGTRRPVALVLRALVWLAMLSCSFAASHLLAVADAAHIGFSAPIFASVRSEDQTHELKKLMSNPYAILCL